MKFNEKASITGYLQIVKAFPDGTEEIVFDDHNVQKSSFLLIQNIAPNTLV